jgi:hypothetical protein
MDRLQSKLDLIDVRMNKEFTSLESQVNLDLTSLDIRPYSLDQLMSSDFNGVKTELSGVSNTANRLRDKMEKHDAQMATALMETNRNLSQKILDKSGGFECGGTRGWRCTVYLDMKDANTDCPSGWQLTGYSKRTCSQISTEKGPVTQPSSLSAEDSTVKSQRLPGWGGWWVSGISFSWSVFT